MTKIYSQYFLFAALATSVNLGLQRIVLLAGQTDIFFVAAMVLGTIAGLIFKYILDRKYIFALTEGGAQKNIQSFMLYSLTGLITTIIFWSTEALFWYSYQSHAAREVGAVIGLSFGYLVKFSLDRRFVFEDIRL